MSTRTDCRITQTDKNIYRLDMPVVDGKTYYMDITYRVDPDGILEEYNVRIVSSERS
jgi:hypothetical protein